MFSEETKAAHEKDVTYLIATRSSNLDNAGYMWMRGYEKGKQREVYVLLAEGRTEAFGDAGAARARAMELAHERYGLRDMGEWFDIEEGERMYCYNSGAPHEMMYTRAIYSVLRVLVL